MTVSAEPGSAERSAVQEVLWHVKKVAQHWYIQATNQYLPIAWLE
jgi:hypothetical protein